MSIHPTELRKSLLCAKARAAFPFHHAHKTPVLKSSNSSIHLPPNTRPTFPLLCPSWHPLHNPPVWRPCPGTWAHDACSAQSWAPVPSTPPPWLASWSPAPAPDLLLGKSPLSPPCVCTVPVKTAIDFEVRKRLWWDPPVNFVIILMFGSRLLPEGKVMLDS